MKKRNKHSAPLTPEENEFAFVEEPTPAAKAEEAAPAGETDSPAPETTESPAPDAAAADAEEASAPETPAAPPEKRPAGAGQAIFRIAMPLTAICIAAALMLAAVNALTAPVIKQNDAAEKENAVLALFPDAEGAALYCETDGAEIYYAYRGGELLGCSLGLSENGFGGAIQMMVAVNADRSVRGVRILSMSETPGVGSKTNSDAFLSRFTGEGPFTVGKNLDAVSGATISSRAIARGVNRALELQPDPAEIAAEAGLRLASGEEADDDPQRPDMTPVQPAATDAPAVDPAPSPVETSAPEDTDAPETTADAAAADYQPIVRTASVSRVTVTSAETVRISDDEPEEPTETEPPVTDVPVETEPPVTDVSAETEPPVTDAPAETEPSVTDVPAETEPPVTDVPAETEPPVTDAPAETEPPVTDVPAETEPPVTGVPAEAGEEAQP